MSSSVASTGAESDGLASSPEQLLIKLDELLASSPPLDVYSAHGTDYSTQLDGIRKVKIVGWYHCIYTPSYLSRPALNAKLG